MTSAVRLKSASGVELRDVLRDRVAPLHRPQDAVVSRLERDVQMERRRVRLAERGDQVVGEVVHLDGGQPKPLDTGERTGFAHESRERVPGFAVAEAAEVDAREDDLAMPLRHAPLDLGKNGSGAAAPRAAANERDHAERARERAAVLDLHERARALETRVRLDAADRADVARDDVGNVLARPCDHGDVGRDLLEGVTQVRGAARHVDPSVRPRGARDGLARLRDGLVRHAARVDDGDVAVARDLHVPVAEQALAHCLRVGVRHLAAQEADGEARHRGD